MSPQVLISDQLKLYLYVYVYFTFLKYDDKDLKLVEVSRTWWTYRCK
jgi:hypothetical protein